MQTKGKIRAQKRIEFGLGFVADGSNGVFEASIKNYDTNDPAPPVASKAILSNKTSDTFESFVNSFPQDMDEAVLSPFILRYLQQPSTMQTTEEEPPVGEFKNLAYPNPNNGTFKVALQTEWHTQKVVLSDVHGKVIYELEHPESETLFIDLPNAPKGLYQLSIFCNKGILTQKMMVQ